MSFRASGLIRWIFRGWLCVALAGGAGAREIYVSPEGDDANPGTRELPWKTLAQVSSEAGPGDTFLFLPGEYSGRLIPARSSRPERPIVFRAAEPRRAVWYAPSGSGAVIELRGLQHITLDGLHVTGREQSTWFFLDACRQITIKNCRFGNASSS